MDRDGRSAAVPRLPGRAERVRALRLVSRKREVLMARTGGQVNDGSRRVERGRMPKGSLEEPMTITEGPWRLLRKRRP